MMVWSSNKITAPNCRRALQFRCAGFIGRGIRRQRPRPAAVGEFRRSAAPMNHPTPNQVSWLLVDLCEKAGYSMAIRDNERFQAVAVQGPDAFSDAVLAAEGITPELNKQLRRGLNKLVAARFAQWEAESSTEH